jgi:hypothetical protein
MSAVVSHAASNDRVRANTWPEVNHRLDTLSQLRIRAAAAGASSDELSTRIEQFATEWDIERVLETEAALMGLIGLGLGVGVDRRFLALPAVVATMLIVHATHGWYPLLPLFRRMGLRTQDEIDRERYALKAIRGDFHALPAIDTPAASRAAAAWEAVCA